MRFRPFCFLCDPGVDEVSMLPRTRPAHSTLHELRRARTRCRDLERRGHAPRAGLDPPGIRVGESGISNESACRELGDAILLRPSLSFGLRSQLQSPVLLWMKRHLLAVSTTFTLSERTDIRARECEGE